MNMGAIASLFKFVFINIEKSYMYVCIFGEN